ncbi:MAG: hypothetical protein HPY69_20510 [Armatimonadetes bacterium]|nr:hypothetical protein [Armatimonadota bacterium]
MAELAGLRPRAAWFSYLGALGGCLDYLGVEASPTWLAGGTGTAFIMNMQANADVASPIAWDGLCVNPCRPTNPGLVMRLGGNVGYAVRAVCGCPHGQARELDEKREQAWDLVRESIDQGLPCLGFELAHPEFFTISGYTDEGYLFIMAGDDGAPDTVAGPKPWRELGAEIGWVRVEAVSVGDPAPDEVVVREALRSVSATMTQPPGPGEFILGLVGYDMWAKALHHGTADRFGHRYNAACWAELRTHAAAFLRETKERLPGRADGLLEEAAGHYQAVADKLQAARALHPFLDAAGEHLQSDEAAGLVQEAGASESQGFPLLGRIADALA